MEASGGGRKRKCLSNEEKLKLLKKFYTLPKVTKHAENHKHYHFTSRKALSCRDLLKVKLLIALAPKGRCFSSSSANGQKYRKTGRVRGRSCGGESLANQL